MIFHPIFLGGALGKSHRFSALHFLGELKAHLHQSCCQKYYNISFELLGSNNSGKDYIIKVFCYQNCYQNCSDLLWEKKCSSDWEKLLKFEAEGQEFAKFLRSQEQFFQTVKGQNNFW